MNKRLDIRMFVLAATIALLTASCAQEPGGGDVRAAIEAQAAKWQKSFNAGDGAGIAALYTDDGQIMPPGAATVSGREGIAAYWQDALSAGGASVSLEVVEVVAQGNHATDVGRFTMTDADGNTIDQGKYLVLWRQEQGEWRLARDIWNSDGAPAAEAAASSGNPVIDEALSAAPPSIAATATVVDWDGKTCQHGRSRAATMGDYMGFNAAMALSFVKVAAEAAADARLVKWYGDCLLQKGGKCSC